MSAGNVGTVFVELQAKVDKLEAQLGKVEQRAKQTGQRIEKSIGGGVNAGLAGGAAGALKGIATFAAVERAASAVGNALIRSASDPGIRKRDIFADAVRNLPVVGSFAQLGEGIRLSVTGEAQALKAEVEAAKGAESNKQLTNRIRLQSTQQRLQNAQLAARGQGGRLFGFQGQQFAIRSGAVQQQAAIEKQIGLIEGKPGAQPLVKAMRELIGVIDRNAQIELRRLQFTAGPGQGRQRVPRFDLPVPIGFAEPVMGNNEVNRLLGQIHQAVRTGDANKLN